MSRETEKKIFLNSSEAEIIIKRCEQIFGFDVLPYIQSDEYFDTLDEVFRKEDYTVRLRTDHLPDKKLYKIAVKGPRIILDDNKGYTRIDVEFSASSYEEFQDEISRKSLICVAKLEKNRWKFKKDGVKVTIDKYPFIGFFLEIEALKIEQIEEYTNLLDLASKDSIIQNSTELLETELKTLGLPVRPNFIATFELENKFYKNHNQ